MNSKTHRYAITFNHKAKIFYLRDNYTNSVIRSYPTIQDAHRAWFRMNYPATATRHAERSNAPT